MGFLVEQKDIDGALQAAAAHPFEGVDPGFVERMKADFNAMQDFSNSNAEHRNALQAQTDFQNQFYQASGQRLPGWIDSVIASRKDEAEKIFNQWKEQNPDSKLTFPSPEDFQKNADDLGLAARNRSEDLARRSTGIGSTAGGILGTIGGAITDPINLLSSGFGASASAGILRTALVEAAVNAGSEAAVQGATFDRKSRLDPTFSVDDALGEVAAAAAGGAVLGAGFKSLANIWHRARTGEWPSHVRDTANVVMREAAVPDSRFEKSMPGDNAHRAALQKSLDDIINGRPVELPPEVFVQQNVRPGRVYDADGRSVGVRYEVVDASSLVTSNRDDLSINPDFPQELQPRDRTRALSQDQIAGIASNLQPERLGFSNDAGSGAPVVGPDGLVESGNGRVLALRRAYQQDGPQAQSYRNFLRAQNFDIEGMQNPVLIARRVTDLEDRVAFVTAANRSTAMKMGAAEQAIADGRLIDGPMLDRLESGDVRAAGNAAFTRDFMSKLPRAEQGSLIDKDGFLSQEGERRVTAALMGRAYGEPTLLGRTLEDTDNNIKAIGGALADASGSWAKMRDAVARGEIPAGMDVTQDLLDAVSLVMRARDEGRTVSDLVNQAEMFGGPGELAKIMARAMFTDEAMKRPVGRARLGAFLKDFADEAIKNDAGPRLFGDALEAPDILKSSLERVGRNDLLRVAEERLTPEAADKLAADPQTAEASIMDAERLIADREELSVAERKRLARAKEQGFTIEGFHGTNAVFNEFDPLKLGGNTGVPSAKMGFFFAKNPATANSYLSDGELVIYDDLHDLAPEDAQKLPSSVRKTIRDAQKMNDLAQEAGARGDDDAYEHYADESAKLWDKAHSDAAEYLQAGNNIHNVMLRMKNPFEYDFGGESYRSETYASIISRAKESGHDGVILKNTVDGGPVDDIYVVFDKDQIRSKFDQFESSGEPTENAARPPSSTPIMIDLGDGQGERDLADILREADEEIAAGKEIEACTIGSAAE
ncbi:hypothetical protein FHT78_005426 [Rhizobium sp. BK196]|uniref:hypothetical protein n=1 Tax=Rhizobium sp. BK196 TaxID=2587073 RepID=UPI0016170B8E|nr:hypothetical protein [Rhizobium sp. BK196]MBB3313632.1 hypothetical protein [Rhizobium sp. BK196]